MSEHAVQFKGWQMGTWFIIDQSEITQQLRLMLETNSGTKVKVRLDKNGLKLTKINAIPLMEKEKKIPLAQIKSIFTDPKFPLCFFCSTHGPDGYLMKVIVIRCEKELCAKGIANYYQTITYKRPAKPDPSNGTPAILPPNEQAVVTSVGKNGDVQMNSIDKDNEKVKEMETPGVPNTENSVVSDKEKEGTETQAKNIKKLSAEVNAIEQKTLKKHPATISHKEYVNAHETVHQFAAEVTKPNTHHYPNANAKIRVQNNSANQRSLNKYYIVNQEGKLIQVVRKRAKTVNIDPRKYPENIPRRVHAPLLPPSNKENEEIKSQDLPEDSKMTSDTTAQVNASDPDNNNISAIVPQEPIYAQVVKKKAVTEPAKEETTKEASNQANDSSGKFQAIAPPLTPQRTVKFNKWSKEVQALKRESRGTARPHSFHQTLPLNTYVSKPIEKVYDQQGSQYRSLKQKERPRPRVNSITFNDGKQLVIYRRGDMLI